MLDDYKEKQVNAYNIMMNEIENNHICHAYLFDENNNNESFDIVMAFVKAILCCNIDNEIDRQLLCKRINDGNYSEIRIIEPDGMFIKKQQIINLQQEFSRAAVEGNKRIYIIRECEKMRPETANSMLKFLEEPDNDIIAILMTNNYNNLLSTIISRCQIIRLGNNSNDGNNQELDEIVLNFIKNIEDIGIRTIMKEKEIVFDYISIKDREKLVNFFDKMIDMYYDIMKININEKNIENIDYYNELLVISKKNTIDNILNKINYLIEVKDSVKYNVNCNLLFDSLIINIGG